MRPRLALLLPLLALPLGCGPSVKYTDADVPKLPQLGDVMWAQSQAADPQFKKIGNASYTDDDYLQFMALAGRLALTTERLKADFSKGPEFNGYADRLASHAQELASAAQAKDAEKSRNALRDMKATCKGCHAKFK